MTYTPIAKGSIDWDVPLNAALTDQDSRITTNTNDLGTLSMRLSEPAAVDQNMLAWTYDVATVTAISNPTSGSLFMSKIRLPRQSMVTGVNLAISAAGTLTGGQNFVGLYDVNGTLVAASADQTANWGTAGFKSSPFASPITAQPGYYYIGMLMNGTTPSVARGSNFTADAGIVNAGFGAATARYAVGGTALTSLPGSVTMGSRTTNSTAWWTAIY